jgi:hypothetical protein
VSVCDLFVRFGYFLGCIVVAKNGCQESQVFTARSLFPLRVAKRLKRDSGVSSNLFTLRLFNTNSVNNIVSILHVQYETRLRQHAKIS